MGPKTLKREPRVTSNAVGSGETLWLHRAPVRAVPPDLWFSLEGFIFRRTAVNEETQARLQRLRDTTLEAIELFKLAKEARKQSDGIGVPEDLRRSLVNTYHTLCSTATKLLQGIGA